MGKKLLFIEIPIFAILTLIFFLMQPEFIAILTLLFGFVFFAVGFALFGRRRLIMDIPKSKIRSLAMGLAEVFGEVEPAEKLIKSPFYNRDCVYFQAYGGSAVSEKITPFYIKDETGKILVKPEGATIGMNPVLKSWGEGREFIVKPGDKLYVIGTVMENLGAKKDPDHTSHLMIGAGENEKIFYISTTEKSATRDIGILAIIFSVVGAILLIGSFLSAI
jgi:hypothetical protein